MPSRDLKNLHPDLLPLAKDFAKRCNDAGVSLLFTCTWRSNAEQDELYAQGRTKPGKIVTNARAGQSEHNFMLNGEPAAKAFDVVPLVNGAAVWDVNLPPWCAIEKIWASGIKSENYYLDWYGKPGAKFSEKCHFCLKEVNHAI